MDTKTSAWRGTTKIPFAPVQILRMGRRMTRGDDDDDDQPVDEVALAAARRRLDATIAKYPELVGPSGPDNVNAGSNRWVIPRKRLGAEHVTDFIIGERDSVGWVSVAVRA